MRMRVGDIEMDTSSGVSFGSNCSVPVEAEAESQTSLVHDITAVPRPIFVVAAFLAILTALTLTAVTLVTGSWLGLVPVPFLVRFAAYAAVLGTRQPVRTQPPLSLEARNAVVAALDAGPKTADELAAQLGWSETRLLSAIVRLIELNEVEEDLEIETGEWRYRRVVQFGAPPDRVALPATERLEAIQATQPLRRNS